jgi:hypothetical protein
MHAESYFLKLSDRQKYIKQQMTSIMQLLTKAGKSETEIEEWLIEQGLREKTKAQDTTPESP